MFSKQNKIIIIILFCRNKFEDNWSNISDMSEDPLDFSDDSEGEDENVNLDEYSDDSETSKESTSEKIQELVEQTPEEEYKFYIGKDETTLWVSNRSAVEYKPKHRIKILSGPTPQAKNTRTELDAFLKFMSLEMIESIVNYTNIYIQKKKIKFQFSRERDYKFTNCAEVQAVFGVLFLIAVKRNNHTSVLELWSKDGAGMVILRAAFSYKRFLFLLRVLRFDDYRERIVKEETDKLAPIRNIYQKFVENCKQNYTLGESVAVDNMLLPYRGRCGFVQYMSRKQSKYGLKLYALVDNRSYYTWNFEVCCRTQKEGPFYYSNNPIDIVKRMVEPLKNSNRNLTLNSYYSTYSLIQDLLETDIKTIAAVKKHKLEIPPEFLPEKTGQVGSFLAGYQDDMTLVSYVPKRNKSIILLSTIEEKPHNIILEYNKTRNSVDTIDKMCSSFSTQRITKRWPLALFFRMLDIAGINSEIIYNANQSPKKPNRRQFLINLAFQLLENNLKERAQLRGLPQDIKHFLSDYRVETVVVAVKFGGKGPCYECGLHKNCKTTIICSTCEKFVCLKHCDRIATCHNCQMEVEEDT